MKREEYRAWCAEVDLADWPRLKELHKYFDAFQNWPTRIHGKLIFERIKNRMDMFEMREIGRVIHDAPLTPTRLIMSQQDYDDIVEWSKEYERH